LSRTVAFLAETPGSASIEEQKACLAEDDVAILAERRSFKQLGELLARNDMTLKAGDHVKVYDLQCLALSTPMLIRVMTRLLKGGVSVEIVAQNINIQPGADDRMHQLLEALDSHYRHVHGIKTHPIDTAPQGRKRLLDPTQLSEIRA
jgi:hypothetical protein